MVKKAKPQNPLMFTITNRIREGWMIEIPFQQFVGNSNAKSYRNSDTLLTISIYFCMCVMCLWFPSLMFQISSEILPLLSHHLA